MTPTPHPHFDDRGVLDWSTRWNDALSRARTEGKLVLVEFGRELCSNCRALVQGAIPHPEVAPRLAAHVVGLAADCDDPEDEVLALAENLPDAMTLPFTLFADANGRFLAGAEGAQSPKSLLALLDRALAAR